MHTSRPLVYDGHMRFARLTSVLLLAQGTAACAFAQAPEAAQGVAPSSGTSAIARAAVDLPPGTPLWLKIDREHTLRLGEPIQAHLVYATFAENQEVLPAGTLIEGSVVALDPDRSRRNQARLRADFTPFSRPEVQFSRVHLPSGEVVALQVDRARAGAPVLQLTPPPAREGGLVHRGIETGKAMVKDRLATFTAPGKKERLQKLLYSQLPYHPQQIASGTVWTTQTTAPLHLAALAPELPPANSPAGPVPVAMPVEADTHTWTLQAYLSHTVSSAQAKVGQSFEAVVAQPVLDSSGAVAVPQGAVLRGEITRARPARRFGRAGELRFDFRELSFPGSAAPEKVQTTIDGIDTAEGAQLSLDREGQVKPKPKDRVVVPAVLLLLAARPLDRDHGDGAFGKDAVASNSLGVLGFIVGTAGGWPNVAAGIGYYGSAISLWNRWIKRGEETTLRENTRVVVQTTARRSAPLGKLKAQR